MPTLTTLVNTRPVRLSSSISSRFRSSSHALPPLSLHHTRTFSCERRGEQSAEAGKVLLPVVVVVNVWERMSACVVV